MGKGGVHDDSPVLSSETHIQGTDKYSMKTLGMFATSLLLESTRAPEVSPCGTRSMGKSKSNVSWLVLFILWF